MHSPPHTPTATATCSSVSAAHTKASSRPPHWPAWAARCRPDCGHATPARVDGRSDAGHDVDAVLHTRDLVGGEDILFSATGITGSADVPGLQYRAGRATTHSVAMRSSTGTVLVVEGAHLIDRLPDVHGA